MTDNGSVEIMQRWLSGTISKSSSSASRTRLPKRGSSSSAPIPKLRFPVTTSAHDQRKKFEVVISHGSIVHFAHPQGAIVNAANEECIGGGGVDGAISAAGGQNLLRDRTALPVLDRYTVTKKYPRTINILNPGYDDEDHDEVDVRRNIRCPTGEAKMTGPGSYGSLEVSHVIHAVGPNYYAYSNIQEADALLRSAYLNSLERAKEAKLKTVAFSLLSAGVFRGSRTQEDVIEIGFDAICDFDGYEELEEVHLCAFSNEEFQILEGLVTRE